MMINFITRLTHYEFYSYHARIEVNTSQTFNDQQDSNKTVQLMNQNSTTDILDLPVEPTLLISVKYFMLVLTIFHGG